MSRQCGFCQRWFDSKQSVRIHLRYCKEYNELKAQGLAGPKPRGGTVYRCENCGHEQPEDFKVCPSCAVRTE